MSRTVQCRKHKKELEGLERAPYPGPKGEAIFATISKQAWQEWLNHQTMIINEKRLNLMEASTQSFLAEEFEKFMDDGDYERPEGYVPEEK
ncbi:MAG: oxidative damage protection protein [Moraxellaceae bacterium]|nr:MAG: oxidative damage protection protein [Moraxellaceae bacterium]